MVTIAALITIVAGLVVGSFFGKSIRGTTIGGLKFALVFWPALLATVIGLAAGLSVGAPLPGAATGLASGLIGSVLGYLKSR
jgi:hypothetical protein